MSEVDLGDWIFQVLYHHCLWEKSTGSVDLGHMPWAMSFQKMQEKKTGHIFTQHWMSNVNTVKNICRFSWWFLLLLLLLPQQSSAKGKRQTEGILSPGSFCCLQTSSASITSGGGKAAWQDWAFVQRCVNVNVLTAIIKRREVGECIMLGCYISWRFRRREMRSCYLQGIWKSRIMGCQRSTGIFIGRMIL